MKIEPKIILGGTVRSIFLMRTKCESCGQKLHEDKESGKYFCTNEDCSQFIEYVDWIKAEGVQFSDDK